MHRNSSWHSHIYTSSDQHILFSPNLLAPCFSNVITCRQWQNDTRAASTASAHVNPHYYLLRKVKIKKKKKKKGKDISFRILGQEKDVFLDFQIKCLFLWMVKFSSTGVVRLTWISQETHYFEWLN